MPLPIEDIYLTSEELELLRAQLGATLVDAEVTDFGSSAPGGRYIESYPDDFCLLHVEKSGEAYYLTVQSLQRDVREDWDIPRPLVKLHRDIPPRPEGQVNNIVIDGVEISRPVPFWRHTFNGAIKRIEVYQYSGGGESYFLRYDAALLFYLANGNRLLLFVDESVVGWVKVAHTEEGISTLLKGLDLRLVLE